MTRNYRSSIPKASKEVVEKTFENGAKEKSFFFLNGEKVGFRQWEEDGTLFFEYGIRNGKKHGREYFFHRDCEPYEVTPYRNGQIHGKGVQWADDGSVLITYRMKDGVGLDLWCDQFNGKLAEELYWPKAGEVGVRRNWNSDDKTIYEEYFFVNGKGYHGIWREWNSKGNIRRGFPHYFVDDKRVTKRQYIRVAGVDATLLQYKEEDDQPFRKLPKEYLDQRRATR